MLMIPIHVHGCMLEIPDAHDTSCSHADTSLMSALGLLDGQLFVSLPD